MSRLLSERETAVLRAIKICSPGGVNADDLVWRVRGMLGSISPLGVTAKGIGITAGALVRKNLTWRDGQVYRITNPGRQALKGDMAGKWRARA